MVGAYSCVTGLGFLIGMVSMISHKAEVQTRTVEYQDGDVELQGFVAWDPDLIEQVKLRAFWSSINGWV